MPTESEQLDRDAMLMLYAADELPQAQGIVLEAQLATDPALAASLEQMRQVMAQADDAVRALDEVQRPPVSSAVAVRRATRAMQQWGVDRMRKRVEPEKKHVAVPWWIYPSAAAAILIVSFLVWSGRQEIKGLPALPTPSDTVAVDDQPASSTTTANDADELANKIDATFEPQNTSVAIAVDDSARASVTDASDDDGGTFFLSPREEQAQ